MAEHSRKALDDCTNCDIIETPTNRQEKRVSSWLPTPPATVTGSRVKRATKRRAGGDGATASKKRVKLCDVDDPFLDGVESESGSSAWESDSEEDEGTLSALREQRIPRANLWLTPVSRLNRPLVSTRLILESFVSSHKSDVFKCQSTNESTYLTPPYACAYSNAAKTGGPPLLAVSTEQGTVHILNTVKRRDWDAEPSRATLQLHDNGIFDVKWNASDTLLATCSADHSTHITCTETHATTHILRGHASTVKCIAWNPEHPDLLATGGRDGTICFWDLRVGNRGEGDNSEDSHANCAPVVTIRGAHEAAHVCGGKLKTKRGKKDPLPRTVTSLLYPDTMPYGLVSSGAFDGVLRYWDLRQPISPKRPKTAKARAPTYLYSTREDPTRLHGPRSRGIISLAGGHGPTAGVIFGLGADSRVHTYTLPRLEVQENIFVHEHLQSSSFYSSLSVSPCGQWLASGGGIGMKGSAFLFDVADATRPWRKGTNVTRGVELKGQQGEVGTVDWSQDMVATCADDGTVRIWRADVEVHDRCVTETEESQWGWAWAI